jgi:hypothetical protein
MVYKPFHSTAFSKKIMLAIILSVIDNISFEDLACGLRLVGKVFKGGKDKHFATIRTSKLFVVKGSVKFNFKNGFNHIGVLLKDKYLFYRVGEQWLNP